MVPTAAAAHALDQDSPGLKAPIGAAFDKPLLSNQFHGGKTPILPQKLQEELGFSVAIYPTAGLFAAAHSLQRVYDSLANGRLVEHPLIAFDGFLALMTFRC